MLNRLDFYFFSPTGGTKKAGEIVCQGLSEKVYFIDLGIRDQALGTPESETIVVAVPVFGGRIPVVVAERLRHLEGGGKKAVTLVVYGTRAYEDALLELNDIIQEQGFEIVASAALIAQHSIVSDVGKGRPDEQDQAEILGFTQKVVKKLENGEESLILVPGNRPYKEGMNMPVTPISQPSCIGCGKCVSVCPTGSVCMNKGVPITDAGNCMLCMACVAACPEHARILPPPLQEQMNQKLGALSSVRRENEYFL